jgi:hypothetical protein
VHVCMSVCAGARVCVYGGESVNGMTPPKPFLSHHTRMTTLSRTAHTALCIVLLSGADGTASWQSEMTQTEGPVPLLRGSECETSQNHRRSLLC